MASIKATVKVTAAGNTPFGLTELSEVTDYIGRALQEFGRNFTNSVEARLVDAAPATLTFEFEGEFP